MAKRKTARRKATSRGSAASRARTTTRAAGGAARRATARTTTKSGARKPGPKATAAPARKRTGKTAAGGRKRPAAPRKRPAASTREASGMKTRAATSAGRRRKTAPSSRRPTTSRVAAPRSAPKRSTKTLQRRETPARRLQIERDRRLIEETLPTPPSTLDFDRSPSAARTGRAEMAEAYGEHNAANPGITGGDVDADWESAYSTGDEAPGGDMPTPDQDVVEEIGSALGVQYADGEELKGANKIEQRDRHRWELDPASAEDYQDRARQK